MKQLIHNGVIVPKYEPKGFHIFVKGQKIDLTPEQEEMAVAWVKKKGTVYVEDPTFVKNFFRDFRKALNIKENLSTTDFDFSLIDGYVERERTAKLNMPKEEKKKLAQQRKEIREANKEKYGYAIVDGVKVETSNYMVEPSSIFMGRGEHPLRGSWKAGASESDVTLNLSPDAPTPEGNWKERIWQPDYMWIASWEDKLNGKRKYVWLSDAYDVKQTREIEKFDKAVELEGAIKKVLGHIAANLNSTDVTTRKIATVCYLIDVLKLRVGDEKDKDEADTVGATTLRPEHITFGANGLTTFDFLGKDSVRWQKEVELPEIVVKNLQEFMSKTESSIFKGIRSKNVSLFLDGVMPGLTAKVFRTYHASKTVKNALHKTEVKKSDPEYVKKHVATIANLQAAIVCNHKKKIPKNWQESLQKKKDRLKKIKASKKKTKRNAEAVEKLRLKIEEMKTTKDYNLRTSLKSYIDPRIYHDWGKGIDFDWKIYYPKALQTKFSWIEKQDKA